MGLASLAQSREISIEYRAGGGLTKTRTEPDPWTRLNLRKTRMGIWARMGIVGIGHWAYGPGKSQEEISGETGMEIPKPVGCISRDLTMQEVLHYFYNHQSYPVSKCPATRPEGGELFLYSLLPGNKGM